MLTFDVTIVEGERLFVLQFMGDSIGAVAADLNSDLILGPNVTSLKIERSKD